MSITLNPNKFDNVSNITTYITWGVPTTSHMDDISIHFKQSSILIPASQINDFDVEVSGNVKETTSVPSGSLPFNYIDSDGNIQATFSESGFFQSNRYYWDDLRVPLESTKTGGAKDPSYEKFIDNNNGSQGVYCYKFTPSLEKELFFSIQIPHNYKEGSNIFPHVHWTPSSSGDGYVIWGLEYAWANIKEAWPYTTIIKESGLGHADQNHSLMELGTINGSGKTISSMLMCRLFRDTDNDDYSYDAGILEFDIHYLVDSYGSWEEYNKF